MAGNFPSKDVYQNIQRMLEHALEFAERERFEPTATGETCPKCGGELYLHPRGRVQACEGCLGTFPAGVAL